jgi:hypothetical protein
MCCCCVDYLLTSLTIATSTHTNYFDQIFKERGAKAPLSRPIIQSRFSLSTPCRLLFFRSGSEQNCLTPNEPTIITHSANLSTFRFNFISRLPAPSELPAPERTAYYTGVIVAVKSLFLFPSFIKACITHHWLYLCHLLT